MAVLRTFVENLHRLFTRDNTVATDETQTFQLPSTFVETHSFDTESKINDSFESEVVVTIP